MPSPIIPLESIQIATPCRADWNAMQKVQGNDCIRFCPSCGKNVYDLSGMTREQATSLIVAKEGNVCLRLHTRSDGTVITSDCPVGKSAQTKRRGIMGGVVALCAAILGLFGVQASRSVSASDYTQASGAEVTMGVPCMPSIETNEQPPPIP